MHSIDALVNASLDVECLQRPGLCGRFFGSMVVIVGAACKRCVSSTIGSQFSPEGTRSSAWAAAASSQRFGVLKLIIFSSSGKLFMSQPMTVEVNMGFLWFWAAEACLAPLAVIRNRRLNSVALLDPLRSVQFSSASYAHRQQRNAAPRWEAP